MHSAVRCSSLTGASFRQNHAIRCTKLRNARQPSRRAPLICTASAAGSGSGDPSAGEPTPAQPSASAPGSSGAVAVPSGVPPAGAVFVLAGFLKLMIMCFPFSTMAVSMFVQGRADLGVLAVAKMLPLALGLLALAKYLVDKKAYRSAWFSRGIALGGIAALVLSRWVFARPRPSPLDPMFQAYRQHQMAERAEMMRQHRMAEGRHGGSRLLQTSGDEAKRALEERSGSGTRFKS